MALKSKQIEHAKEGMHADGGGLYLRVQESGAKSWIFRFQLNGRRREMGIGILDVKSPPDARAEAAQLAAQVRAGIDPIEARKEREDEAKRTAGSGDTFKTLAAEYIKSHRAGWKNAKHADQWGNTLKTYADPVIGDKRVSQVTTEDVLQILKPLWNTKTETARRVRSRIELVLSYGKAMKMRQGENPAAWRGHLDALLPKPSKVKKVRHHPALPFGRMPEFMAKLRSLTGVGAKALELAILTATRSGEVRTALWSEIDLTRKVWIIPAERMKAKREHRVPLSKAAMQLLNGLERHENTELLFFGERGKKSISDMTLTAVIRRMNADAEPPVWLDPTTGAPVVPHGFRSTFRDWAAEATNFPHEMVEMALAHTVDNKVEAAYRRGDMFEKRHALMDAWAKWCSPKPKPASTKNRTK
ncbi:MAG: integrase arm-type DNA-binding domain-containing protein [Gammaproteobacteria bacterium]|nr:integrase arm-type DNA-binding domain-containing protein [Gammaproteobacteria bacterium]MBU0785493.1 integrase arm-type DNA-binding domain-containing protein [Gammaproteobacteria bacterium]MBU0813693.1 integrase arm-type DNA-binding domain-containing protein [Gammaproteobacteria bacterium]MBU1788835.1 integrase arm-type DNA-binding domain-containing protein [Gammaproteobacteria bacterium]